MSVTAPEIFIEKPSSFRAQSETFSHYKHHNTAKSLLAIAPHGEVTFTLPLYGGRQSDKAMLLACGLLDKVEEGNLIMADRGFNASDAMHTGVALTTPSFLLAGAVQFSREEESSSRRVVSVRVHVERAIRRVKTFIILDGFFPFSMKPSLDMIWQVCCRLTNFLPLLIASKDGPAELKERGDDASTAVVQPAANLNHSSTNQQAKRAELTWKASMDLF